MIVEQEYLFETKLDLFCKVNNFKYSNIMKIMLEKHEDLINKIVESSDDELSINKNLNENEMKLISEHYNKNLLAIQKRIDLICSIGNINKLHLEKEIMKSQDLVKRLIKQPIEKYAQCLEEVNKMDNVNIDKIRLEKAMKFLNKSIRDTIVGEKYGKR